MAENLLKRSDDTDALIWHDELGTFQKMTWSELNDQVSSLQQSLRELGIVKGDCIAAWLPNRPEAVIIMIAAASLGAVFTRDVAHLGVRGLLDRFKQAQPKLIFVTDGYSYGGKWFSLTDKITQVELELPSIERTVIVPYPRRDQEENETNITEKRQLWSELLERHEPTTVDFPAYDFNHPQEDPLFIRDYWKTKMYSSPIWGRTPQASS